MRTTAPSQFFEKRHSKPPKVGVREMAQSDARPDTASGCAKQLPASSTRSSQTMTKLAG